MIKCLNFDSTHFFKVKTHQIFTDVINYAKVNFIS